MPRYLPYVFSGIIVTLLVAGPLIYARQKHAHLRNLQVVHDGVLYRSGQLSPAGLKRVVHDYRIKTVVTLRDAATPGQAPPDAEEEHWCLKEEINHVRITPKPWWSADGPVPAAAGVARFLEVMSDPANYPVLVHCFAGTHRTGAYVAVYRMEFDGLTNKQAIAELMANGYCNINEEEMDLLGFLEQYRPTGKHLKK